MYNEYLEFAKALAKEAGATMRRYYGSKPEEQIKDDKTIVTIADKEINDMVIERVHERYPDHDIDGEEASHKDNASQYVWVCDPIDGTNPFAMELPVSVFSIALVKEGEPLVGVVLDPYNNKMYYAQKGGGAYCNDKKLAVSDDKLETMNRINFDYWHAAEYEVIDVVARLTRETGIYPLSPGSTTHMAMKVADGSFVASIFPGTKGKNVDIAAAKVIVEEAGGKVTDFFGNEQRYDQDIKGAVLSNGIVHEEIIKLTNEVNQ
jgi:myo-inositol-1(or 4)-monophosphatase